MQERTCRGISRRIPCGLETENPKAQVIPRAKGEEVSHKLPRFLDGDSEASANPREWLIGPGNGHANRSYAKEFSGRPTALRGVSSLKG
jgi:hypothetical protein